MSREIKFRVWHKPTKQFVKQDIFYLDEPSSIGQLSVGLDGTLSRLSGMDYEVSAHVSDPEDYAIQQYTGLKDNNDQEIYEGDIIKKEPGWFYRFEHSGEIYYSDEKLSFYYKCTSHPNNKINWDIGQDFECEVIGNIFEGVDK